MTTSGPNYAGAVSTLAGGTGTWATTGNAVGSNDDLYAVWSKPAATAQTSPGLELATFGTFTGVGSGDTINNVQVSINSFNANTTRMAGFSVELWNGTTAIIGTAQTTTNTTTTTNVDTFTFTGVTFAQLATLRVRVYGKGASANAQASTGSVDYVSLTVDYTSPNATATPATLAATTAMGAVSATGGGGAGTVAPVGSVTDFWKYESSATSGAGVTPWPTVSRTSPAITLAVGDILWAVVSWNAAEATSMTTPPGWTVVTGWPKTQNALVGQVLAYRVITDPVADVATDAQYVWTPNTAARGNVGIRVYRGADTTTPLDATPVVTQGVPAAGVSTWTASQITTVTANAYVIHGTSIEASAATTTITTPTGTTKIWDLIGRRQALAEEGTQAAAGGSGSVSWTVSAASLNYISYQAAFRPGAVSGDATASPAVIAATTAMGAVTATGTSNATATPAAVAATTAIGAPTITSGGSATVNAAAVAATTTIPTPGIVRDVRVTPATLAASTTVGAPAVVYGGTAAPAVVAATTTIPTPGTSVPVVAHPATITVTTAVARTKRLAAFPATVGSVPGLQPLSTYRLTIRAYDTAGNRSAESPYVEITTTGGSAAFTPDPIDVTTAVGTPTVTTTTQLATLAAVTAMPAATASGQISGTRTPATVVVSTAVGTPTVTAGGSATVTPAAVVATTVMPAVTASGQASGTATPATLAATAAIGAVSAGGGATVQAAAIAAVTAMPAVSVGASGSRAPATVVVTTVVGTVTVGGGAATTPATLVVTTTVGAPTVTYGGRATVATVTVTTTIAAQPAVGGTRTPATLVVTTTVGAVAVAAGAKILPATIFATTLMGLVHIVVDVLPFLDLDSRATIRQHIESGRAEMSGELGGGPATITGYVN